MSLATYCLYPLSHRTYIQLISTEQMDIQEQKLLRRLIPNDILMTFRSINNIFIIHSHNSHPV